jgi:hypothetical protein
MGDNLKFVEGNPVFTSTTVGLGADCERLTFEISKLPFMAMRVNLMEFNGILGSRTDALLSVDAAAVSAGLPIATW